MVRILRGDSVLASDDVNPLLNKEMAFDFVQRFLRGKFGTWFSRIPKNMGRHMLFRGTDNDPLVFYCLFKREFLKTFNSLFPFFVRDNPVYGGLAESINVEALEYSINSQSDYLLFVHPDHKIYMISPLAVRRFCNKHGLIRQQDRENEYVIPDGGKSVEVLHETTYVIPLKILERLRE